MERWLLNAAGRRLNVERWLLDMERPLLDVREDGSTWNDGCSMVKVDGWLRFSVYPALLRFGGLRQQSSKVSKGA